MIWNKFGPILFSLLLLLTSTSLTMAYVRDRQVHIVELTRPLKHNEDGVLVSPTVYRLEESLRLDSRVLFNTVEVRDTRRVTSALLPKGFIDTLGGVDVLQGRRAHAFVAPPPIDGRRYQWTHEDFQNVSPQSVVILIDTNSDGGGDDGHEHDLLTPEATDCLIYDKQISVLVTNHRYIDGRHPQQNAAGNYSVLELKFLNHGVVIIVSAAPLTPADANLMGAVTPTKKQQQSDDISGGSTNSDDGKTVSYEKESKSEGEQSSADGVAWRRLSSRRATDENNNSNNDYASLFYAYFMIFQPDRSVPVGLAAVTLLNFTSKQPISLSHEWFPKDATSSPLPVWPGTPKTIVRVTMWPRSRSVLFSEQQSPNPNEQHPSFFAVPLSSSSSGGGNSKEQTNNNNNQQPQQRPSRPHVRVKFAEHYGTHIDAPFHMLPNGTTVSALPKARLFSNCCYKVDLSSKILHGRKSLATERGISIRDYDNYSPTAGFGGQKNCLPLFYTGVSRYWRNSTLYVNHMNFPGVSPELVSMLLQNLPDNYENPSSSDKNVGIGIDSLSLDPGSSVDLSAHVIAAANGAFALENLANLNHLPDGGKPVPCLIIPLKIDGGSGSPAKVIAFLGSSVDVNQGGYMQEDDPSYPFYMASPTRSRASSSSLLINNNANLLIATLSSSLASLLIMLLCYNFSSITLSSSSSSSFSLLLLKQPSHPFSTTKLTPTITDNHIDHCLTTSSSSSPSTSPKHRLY